MTRPLPHSRKRPMAATLTISLIAGLAASGSVLAKCGDTPAPANSPAETRFTPTVFRPDSDAGAVVRTNGERWFDDHSIVGLWEFEFHLKGAQNGLPDGFLLDWGLATWHEDETEIQFSAGRAPSAGDVCMGAWRQTGRTKYKLHHIALGLTPPSASGTFVGPTIIRAEVTVDGDTYSGPYSLTTYAGSTDDGTEFNESGTPLAVFTGTITAKRVKVR